MPTSVKASSGRREDKARQTRRRILDSAERLFVTRGYAATTITAIAEAADVAVQTVYAVFGNKRTILGELLAVRVVGDGAGIPLRRTEQWRAMEREPDPRRQLALLARIATEIGERMGGLYEVLAGAAGSDHEIAQLFTAQQSKRYDDQRAVARALARRGALRPGLSVSHATDILWAVANPTTHHRLVAERRWSSEDYSSWLA